MANRYWVGGSGTWSTTTTPWSATSGGAGGASAPTASDSVFFDQAATYTVTLSVPTCLNLTVSAGTVTFASTGALTVAGSFSVIAGTVWTGTGSITFTSTTTTNTITTNGVSLIGASATTGFVFNGVGGKWTLIDSLTTPADTTLTNGTLDLNGKTLSTKSFGSENSNIRSVAFGSGNIALTGSGTVLLIQTATNFTWTGTGGFTTDASVARSFRFGSNAGGTSSNAPNLTFTSGSSTQSFNTNSWFNKLDFGTISPGSFGVTTLNVNSLTLSANQTYTNLTVNAVGTGTITSNGKSIAAFTVNHTGTTTLADALTAAVTSTTNLNSGTLDLAGFTHTTGGLLSSNANTRAIAFGSGSIALSHTTAATAVLNMGNATNFTVSGTGGFTSVMSVTRTFVFGTTGGTYSNAPNLTLSSGTAAPTITGGSWFNKLDFGTSSGTINTISVNLNSLTLGSGVYTGLSANFYNGGTFTPNNKTISNLTLNSPVTITSGGSTYFNGTADYIETPHTASLDLTSGDFTFECWLYATSVSSDAYAVNKSGISGLKVGAYTLQYRSQLNAWAFTTSNSGLSTQGTFYTFGSGSNVLNTWMHLAVTRVGTTITTYLNGVAVTSVTQGTAIYDSGQTLNIGSQKNGGNYFNGYISNFRIVKGTAVYTSNFTPPTTNLTAVTNTSVLVLQNATTVDNSGNSLAFTIYGSPAPSINDPLPATTYSITTTSLNGSGTCSTLNHSGGIFDITGDTLTVTGAVSAGQVYLVPMVITGGGTGVISVGTGWTGTAGFSGSGYSINMTGATAKTFAGGGGAYGKLVQAGAGALTITGSNSFADIQATTRPSTITITAGTTQTLGNFTLAGISGSLVTVNSSTAGTQYTLSKSSGTASPTYISIRDSNVTGGAYWDLTGSGTNTNVSNNTGWNISLNKILGQFMTFFF